MERCSSMAWDWMCVWITTGKSHDVFVNHTTTCRSMSVYMFEYF